MRIKNVTFAGLFFLLAQHSAIGSNDPVAHSITSETVVTSPVDRSRKKVGVGEEVNLTFVPAHNATWKIEQGSGTLSATTGKTVKFTAPNNPGTQSVTTISATCDDDDEVASISFTTIKPSGVILEKNANLSTSATSPLTLTTVCFVYITPDDVNFEKIQVLEDDCVSEASGYWSYKDNYPHYQPPFNPQPPPANMSGHVDGKGTKVQVQDKVQSVTRGGPYYDGSFKWDIPWRYGIGGSDQGIFATVTMKSTLTTTTLSHTKGGMSDSVSLP